MIYIELTHQPLIFEFLAQAGSPEHGAQVIFTGTVRTPNFGKNVLGVSYDAFEPLARATLTEICDEAQRRWGPKLSIRLHHRLGRIGVGELSVVIVVGARHRDEAYQASRYLIEELKHRVPIWKQEHYENENSEWLQGHALCQGA